MVSGQHGIKVVKKKEKSFIKKVKRQASGAIITQKDGKKVLFHTKMTIKMENLYISLQKIKIKSVKKVGKKTQKMVCGYGGTIMGKKLKKVIIRLGKSMVFG